MAKKNSHISDDKLSKITEQVAGEPVDTVVTPDSGETVVENPTPDITETPVTDEKPIDTDLTKGSGETVVENPVTPDVTETPIDNQNPTPPDTTKPPVVDEKPVTPDSEEIVVEKKTDDETLNDEEPVKIDEFKRFNIRFGYSIDSRSCTTRRTLSTTEIVKQFVKAPTCFIAFETKEDIKDFETLLKIKTIKVEDKEGKLVDFSDAAKTHLIERVAELSKYWIARNSK